MAEPSSRSGPAESPLTLDDLVRDEPLDKIAGSSAIPDELDLLNHRSTARRVAQLASTAEGQLNIAVFGPWGSGKSSFFGLLEQELGRLTTPLTPVRFDAWQNAGSGFRENFLAAVSAELKFPGMDERLFAVKRSVKLPFVVKSGGRRRPMAFVVLAVLALGVVVGLPALQTVLTGTPDEFWTRFWPNWIGWISFGAGSSVIYLVVSTLASVSKVDVEEARPSYVSQFRALFHELLDRRPKDRFAILIDELDRCAPKDVMETLEGLRTFLGHERCVFVVAFDRAAIAEAVSAETPNKVPLREGGAYYATAGEYLDKIFQYQVSLPPQPHHGPRRYALSLVEEKSGVWGSLKQQSPELLRRVVQLLSPIHLRSPRRTKVLLNDFAINMRLYESMGFEWLERAEEIAAWTVIQTEFPGLANAMEQDTRTLGRIADSLRNSDQVVGTRDTEASDELDALEADVLIGDAETAGPELQAIGDELRDDVRTYLRRLLEYRVKLPRADLILMHADGGLLRFDDPDIYNLVQDPAGVTPVEALGLLGQANVADRVQALTYLLEQLESDLPYDERSAILVLVGEVSEMLAATDVRPFKYALRRTWEGHPADRAAIAQSPTAVRGYLRAIVGESEDALRGALEHWSTDRPNAVAAAVQRISDDSTDDELLVYFDALLAAAAGSMESPEVLATLLERVDSIGDVDFERFPNALDAAFTIPVPDVAPPAGRRSSATAEATDVERAASLAYEETSAKARVAFGRLIAGSYRNAGSVRVALRRVLADLHGLDEWPLDIHDQLVLGDAATTPIDQRNNELLEAIATRPESAAERWVDHLDSSVGVDTAKLQRAIETVLRRGAVSTDEGAQADAVSIAQVLLRLRPTPDPLSPAAIIDSARPLADATDWPATRVKSGFSLLTLLETLDGAAPALSDVQLTVALVAYDGVDSTGHDELLSAVEALPETVRKKLASELDWTSNDFATSIVVRCQAGLGSDPSQLVHAASVVSRAPADPGIVKAWLESGPFFAEVERLRSSLPAPAVTADLMKVWASAVDADQRLLMWRVLLSEGDVERAVAAAGTNLPDDALEPEIAALVAASSAPLREEALRPLLAAPSGSGAFRRAVVAAAPVLASAGAQQDLSTLAALLERGPAVSSQERSRIRSFLEGLVSKHPTTLSRQKMTNLVDLNFLNKRGLGALWDRISGRVRADGRE